MLRIAAAELEKDGFRILNLDCIVFAQRPKLGPIKAQIKSKVAEILKLDAEDVGIKAKTGEEVGPVGREEAIMAQCVALVLKT